MNPRERIEKHESKPYLAIVYFTKESRLPVLAVDCEYLEDAIYYCDTFRLNENYCEVYRRIPPRSRNILELVAARECMGRRWEYA